MKKNRKWVSLGCAAAIIAGTIVVPLRASAAQAPQIDDVTSLVEEGAGVKAHSAETGFNLTGHNPEIKKTTATAVNKAGHDQNEKITIETKEALSIDTDNSLTDDTDDVFFYMEQNTSSDNSACNPAPVHEDVSKTNSENGSELKTDPLKAAIAESTDAPLAELKNSSDISETKNTSEAYQESVATVLKDSNDEIKSESEDLWVTEPAAYGRDFSGFVNIIAVLKNEYPNGTTWTNSNQYPSGWYGCWAFANIIAERIFGYNTPGNSWHRLTNRNDIRPGDILRVNNSHTVVVIGVHGDNLQLAEGNYASKIKWDRIMSRNTSESVVIYRAPNYDSVYPDAPSDTEPPVISNVVVRDTSSSGYTVTCTVTDNTGISRVQFPTWTAANGQDDIFNEWGVNSRASGTISGSTVTYRVNVSDHNNESGIYCTHIYAYDHAGNSSCYYLPDRDVPAPGSPMKSGYNRTIPDGDYLIVNAAGASSFCIMDIEGDAIPAANGTNVSLWRAGETGDTPVNNIWTLTYKDGFYSILQKGTNVSLDIAGGNVAEATNVMVHSFHGDNNQRFAISSNGRNGYRIQAKNSGMSLTVAGGGTANGTNIIQYFNDQYDDQSWLFIPYRPSQPLADGRYVILNAVNETVEIDVAGSKGSISDHDTNVKTWRDNALSRYNSFDVKKLNNGYYSFIHAATGKALSVYGGNTTIGRNVCLESANGSVKQQWAITKAGNGYVLRARCSGFALDLENGQVTFGANVLQNPYDAHQNPGSQLWKFVPAQYTVSYHANGGTSAPAWQTKYYREAYRVTDSKPTRQGMTFVEWNTNADGTGKSYPAGSYYEKEASVTLYAQWKPLQNVWGKIDGKWYLYDANGKTLTGWQKVSGIWYYMNHSGIMTTGWQKVSDKWYYMNHTGAMTTGWQKVSGKWYYMNHSGAMTTGWQKISGKWYYMNRSGVMTSGWQKIGNKWYYMNRNGEMQTGWLMHGNHWFYLKSGGAMAANESIVINGTLFRFDANGIWIK